MLISVNLTRFKKFKDTTVHLKPFTILMGENSSGKTTIIQAINLALISLSRYNLISIGEDLKPKIRRKGIGLTGVSEM